MGPDLLSIPSKFAVHCKLKKLFSALFFRGLSEYIFRRPRILRTDAKKTPSANRKRRFSVLKRQL